MLGLGLFLFGATLGGVVGISEQIGISQTLITSLFSFVGGVLLSYGGFRQRQRSAPETSALDVGRVGLGLSCFSLGVMLGLGVGIKAKLDHVESERQQSELRELRNQERSAQQVAAVQPHGPTASAASPERIKNHLPAPSLNDEPRGVHDHVALTQGKTLSPNYVLGCKLAKAWEVKLPSRIDELGTNLDQLDKILAEQCGPGRPSTEPCRDNPQLCALCSKVTAVHRLLSASKDRVRLEAAQCQDVVDAVKETDHYKAKAICQ